MLKYLFQEGANMSAYQSIHKMLSSHRHIHIYTYLYVFVYMYIYIYIYIYVYIYAGGLRSQNPSVSQILNILHLHLCMEAI
jgi:hypothetical protein